MAKRSMRRSPRQAEFPVTEAAQEAASLGMGVEDDLSVTTGGEIDGSPRWDDPRNSADFRGIVPADLNPEIAAIRSPDGYALSHSAATCASWEGGVGRP